MIGVSSAASSGTIVIVGPVPLALAIALSLLLGSGRPMSATRKVIVPGVITGDRREP